MDFNEGKIIPVDINNEMKKCYIENSTIITRTI